MTITLYNANETIFDALKTLLSGWKDVRIEAETEETEISADLEEAIADVKFKRNLYGPYKTAKDAVASMLED